ncbi:hypothetical protein [Segetibacter koreensis]|uniref:hypothetical protein n=1 Tax=Segetibacter koreensis TaxID=398037 RepID=UPI000379F649|nr:hypothetical protein [Segetibacter koreensis]
MKQLQVRPITILTFLLTASYISVAQTKLVVNGAKINMANSVYLSTNDILVSGNSLVNVAQSTIKIAGSTTSKGAIDVRKGTAELSGSAAQQLAAESFAGKIVRALTISNTAGATVNDTLNITDVLTVSKGNLISQGFLTLKSNDSNTARVAPITSVAATPISGDVIVERFITAKRAFRFLTAPVNATTTIRDNWMEGVYNPNTTSGNLNPVPNFGTHITGAGGHLNHFDETITNNSSLSTYNSQTQRWVSATNTDTILKAGQAFSIMVRGSRSTNLNSNSATPSPTTLRAKGALVTGTVVLKSAGAGGTPGMPELSAVTNAYSFIANPYAAPVDWSLLDIKDISSSIYIFDPTITGTYGRGGYVAFNRLTGSSNDSSKIDNNIQSGQAFFVQTTGSSPSVTFRESYKSNLNRKVFRTPTRVAKISLQLILPSQQFSPGAADGLAAYFSTDFSPSIGNEDSYKFTNQDENIAILRDGKTLSIEGRKPVTSNDTIPLKMWQLTSKNYILKISLKNFDDNVDSYLEDAFLHTSTKLSNDTAQLMSFTITSDTLSKAHERFRIVLKNAETLLSQVSTINAYQKYKGVQVEWATKSADNIDKYIVEKSGNAQSFFPACIIKAKAMGGASNVNNWLDENPVKGNNYYRIRYVNKTGEVQYSHVAKVLIETIEGSISVASAEGDKNSLIANFRNIEKGKYLLSLINNNGQTVYSDNINHETGSASYSLKIKNLLPAGVYHLQVSGGGALKNISVLIQ